MCTIMQNFAPIGATAAKISNQTEKKTAKYLATIWLVSSNNDKIKNDTKSVLETALWRQQNAKAVHCRHLINGPIEVISHDAVGDVGCILTAAHQ